MKGGVKDVRVLGLGTFVHGGGGGGRSVHCAKASCNNIKHSRCASPPLNWSRDMVPLLLMLAAGSLFLWTTVRGKKLSL